jgi:hypothetical protein
LCCCENVGASIRALFVREFLASKQLPEHPPYSPDLAPNDFFLFMKIKEIVLKSGLGTDISA